MFFRTRKRVKQLEEDIKKSFNDVKKDFDSVGKWIKHLNKGHEHAHGGLNSLKADLASIKEEIEELKEVISVLHLDREHGQLSKKQPVLNRQSDVLNVQEGVQTPVQTGNFYNILQDLSSNERLIVFTLLNTDMRLSYEDIARLLGKERSTIRGQINAIKRKSEGLIHEITEQSGKKRLYVKDEMKEKLAKYAKVRVDKEKKYKKLPKDY
jgi:biotin operon repressor